MKGTPPRVAIVGVGLIGGSVARALKRADGTTRVVGIDSNVAHLDEAARLGLIDEARDDVAYLAAGIDIVVIATPPRTVIDIARAVLMAVPAMTIVTDVASTKRAIVEAIDDPRFVGAHPIAGTEKSGPSAALADLFDGRVVIVVAGRTSRPDAVAGVEDLWRRTRARTVSMDALTHDRVVAVISHLPHAVAYALTGAIGNLSEALPMLYGLGAGGFQDTTRIASSSPEMWRDIFLDNRDETLKALDAFATSLAELRGAIETRDAATMLRLFEQTRAVRRRVLDAR